MLNDCLHHKSDNSKDKDVWENIKPRDKKHDGWVVKKLNCKAVTKCVIFVSTTEKVSG